MYRHTFKGWVRRHTYLGIELSACFFFIYDLIYIYPISIPSPDDELFDEETDRHRNEL